MAVLEAPMAGKILEINVEVGATIAEDDEVMIVEAMKMENSIYATDGGVVKEIKVKVGDQVHEGDALIVVE